LETCVSRGLDLTFEIGFRVGCRHSGRVSVETLFSHRAPAVRRASMLQCVAMCCSMLQCGAVCCSVSQSDAVRGVSNARETLGGPSIHAVE